MKQFLLSFKAILFLGLFFCFSFSLYSQVQPIPNGSFEQWDTKVLFQNPLQWLSSTDPEFAPLTTIKSDDSQEGIFSLKLTTLPDPSDEDPDRMADGFAVFGSFDDDNVIGAPFSEIVDKMHLYVKYNVGVGDAAAIIVRLFDNNNAVLVEELKFLQGTKTDVWEKIEIDLIYGGDGTPVLASSLLVGFVSSFSSDVVVGLGLDESYDIYTPASGSMLMVDNVYFTLGLDDSQITIPNGSFENWADFSVFEPVGWSSSNYYHSVVFPVTQTTDSYIGDFAARIEVVGDDGQGLHLGDGLFNNGGIPYTDSPKAVKFAYKYAPAANDKGYISVFLKGEPTTEHPYDGFGVFFPIEESVNEYVDVVGFYNYPAGFVHDKLEIQLRAGDIAGSVLHVDDLKFVETFNVNFKVEDVNETSIPHAKVEVEFHDHPYGVDSNGLLDVAHVTGKFSYTVTADGYQTKIGDFTVVDSDISVKVSLLLEGTVGFNNNVLESDIWVYPNPFTDIVYLSNGLKRVKVLSTQGVAVADEDVEGLKTINLAYIKPGIYFFVLETKDGEQVIKRIVRK